ncbi:MAG: alpha/beta fold hydrolase [Desulfobacterales bacterium]
MDVYMIDWGYPAEQDKFLTIDDHVNGYIDDMVNVILRRHQAEQINIMGICMGGTMSVIYAALHPDKVKNLITTVTPSHLTPTKGCCMYG